MNFIKRALILSLILSFAVVKVECMYYSDGDELDTFPNDNYSRYAEQEKIKETHGGHKARSRRRNFSLVAAAGAGGWGSGFDILDYLVQLASIHSIDTQKEKVVDILAKLRILVNACKICLNLKGMYETGRGFYESIKWNSQFGKSFYESITNLYKSGQVLPSSELTRIANILLRGSNIIKDVNISKNCYGIASGNKIRNDKKLKSKKIWQSMWLTLNKLVYAPCVTGILDSIGEHEIFGKKANVGWYTVYYACILSTLSELIRQHFMYKMIENKQKTA